MKQLTNEREGRPLKDERALSPEAAPSEVLPNGGFYVPVVWKFSVALAVSVLWMAFSIVAARAWIHDLAGVIGTVAAHLVVYGVAVVPGFMNAFLVVSLLLDKRPVVHDIAGPLPGVSVLVAAYNEAANIAATIESIARQNYPGPLQVIVINDGSTDDTAQQLAGLSYPWLEVIHLERNGGKANALNQGLARAQWGLTVTVDGDSYLYHDALSNLVRRYLKIGRAHV